MDQPIDYIEPLALFVSIAVCIGLSIRPLSQQLADYLEHKGVLASSPNTGQEWIFAITVTILAVILSVGVVIFSMLAGFYLAPRIPLFITAVFFFVVFWWGIEREKADKLPT